jgi:glutamate synthase (NADPH/NADH) small chain
MMLMKNDLTPKERIAIPRQAMPEQKPEDRRCNFSEVPLGYTPEQAIKEAQRCLQCKNPKCIEGCPVYINIPKFINEIAEGDFEAALDTVMMTNSLPAVCGRVCPQETQCEVKCVLGVKGDPVAIGRLERFVADYVRTKVDEQSEPAPLPKSKPAPEAPKIAIVGSGPSGLTCAADLLQLGYNVTLFEALHEPGGVLVYGIPEFRLPKAIVKDEINKLVARGLEIVTNAVIGRLYTIDDLIEEEGYSAVFIGTGAGAPSFLKIPGENLNGVYSANEFLTRVNLMKAYLPDADTPIVRGKNVVVFGAGNTAMDAARTALRIGADEVHIMYRRSRKEMPARLEEIHHAEDEGIILDLLVNPIEFKGNERGWLTSVICQRMELGEPDDSGRRRPIPIPGSEFETQINVAIIAVGTQSNPLIRQTTPDLSVNKWGYIIADDTGKTDKDGVFAGGDIVTGAATVIEAMGAGKKAAVAIDTYLNGKAEPA